MRENLAHGCPKGSYLQEGKSNQIKNLLKFKLRPTVWYWVGIGEDKAFEVKTLRDLSDIYVFKAFKLYTSEWQKSPKRNVFSQAQNDI